MKIITKTTTLLLMVMVSVGSLFAQGTKEIDNSMVNSNIEILIDTKAEREVYGASFALSNEGFTLEEMLDLAIEDERLALSEYRLIMEKFNISRPFSNIIKAEQSHEKALLNLYDVYGFDVNDFDASSHLVIPDSLEEIYKIGIEAEIANIAMYEKFLTYDLPEDVRRVFTSLRDGSINHLKAFRRQSSKLQ